MVPTYSRIRPSVGHPNCVGALHQAGGGGMRRGKGTRQRHVSAAFIVLSSLRRTVRHGDGKAVTPPGSTRYVRATSPRNTDNAGLASALPTNNAGGENNVHARRRTPRHIN